jgi:uncharacterized Rossmann fold enzyme
MVLVSFDDENASTWGRKNKKHKIPTHLIKKMRLSRGKILLKYNKNENIYINKKQQNKKS